MGTSRLPSLHFQRKSRDEPKSVPPAPEARTFLLKLRSERLVSMAPPTGIEPVPQAPEACTLSVELRGQEQNCPKTQTNLSERHIEAMSSYSIR